MEREWDPTLYAGSAGYYVRGRMPYPGALRDALRDELGLDGGGRLLDVGCGPGSLTMLLAPLFVVAVGIDADPDMIAEAGWRSGQVEWRQLRAEELPAGLGTFRVVTFAQSFHWMDQSLVVQRVRGMVEAGGAWVHVHANTHQGIEGGDPLPHPPPPWERIDELVSGRLGADQRAGQGTRSARLRPGEDDVMRQAGFVGPERIRVAGGESVERDVDDIVAAVFSLSSSAPHLFGDSLSEFEADLRRLLERASDHGRFSERRREVEAVIWRP